MTYKTYKSLEEKPKMLGVPIMELSLVLLLMILLLFIGSILNIHSFEYAFCCIAVGITILIVLKTSNKNGNLTFLLSYIAFTSKQKKKLYVKTGSIPIKQLQ